MTIAFVIAAYLTAVAVGWYLIVELRGRAHDQ
jgi:hypothetical protein